VQATGALSLSFRKVIGGAVSLFLDSSCPLPTKNSQANSARAECEIQHRHALEDRIFRSGMENVELLWKLNLVPVRCS